MREAQHLARLGCWEVNLQSSGIWLSDEARRIFELDSVRDDPSFAALLGAVHPDDRPTVESSFLCALQDRVPWRIVVRLQMRGGRTKWVEGRCETVFGPRDEPIRSTGTVQEITELEEMRGELSSARVQHRLLFEHLPLGMALHELILDDTGTPADYVFLAANPAFERLTGLPVANILGKRVTEVVPGIEQTGLIARYGQVVQTGRPARFDQHVEAMGRHFEVVAYRSRPGRFVALFSDVSEARRTERRAQLRARRLEALRRIDVAITSASELTVTFDILLQQAVAQLEVDAADILVFDSTSGTLRWADGLGFRTDALRGTRLRVGRGHAGVAALERRTVVIPRLADDPGEFDRAVVGSEGLAFCAVAPVVAKGQLCGVLEVFMRRPFEPPPDWLDFLETLAGQAALAVDNLNLFGNLQRSNLDLAVAYDATIEGWSRALDLRDKETEGHSLRVTAMTERLAAALGFSGAELVHARRGALLHDIGKVGIPDAVLLKPGKLTDEEWVIMRRHPVLARDLLQRIPYLRPAIAIPYGHHEKWDGSGYPLGLRGEDIPLAARMFAVVDVWDALRSDRPYRPAWSEDKTRQHIASQIGSHFDPAVARAFLDIDWRDTTP
ncbi:MAG: HD domain-containing protein [Deltaproteobacteria bacterium]|nr:HD domain-containing protein [Deltaproteobacteria bacterium]